MNNLLKHPSAVLASVLKHNYWLLRNDERYVKVLYRLRMGEKLNLRHPVTIQEKMQWLKLYDRKEIYHQMVDKVGAKVFITSRIGGGYNVPTLAVYNSFEEIDWRALPNKFILKATHDSGSYYIVKDKNSIDKKECKKKLYTNWNKDYYRYGREWQYRGLSSRIIVEPLLEEKPYLRDFKFYCFNGEPKIFYITSDKGGDKPTRQDFFDVQGHHLDCQDVHYTNNPVKMPELPARLNEMLELARKLAKDTYHLRVDFYEIDGKIYVGELTFNEASGFCKFSPEHWNKTLGDWIKLPTDDK